MAARDLPLCRTREGPHLGLTRAASCKTDLARPSPTGIGSPRRGSTVRPRLVGTGAGGRHLRHRLPGGSGVAASVVFSCSTASVTIALGVVDRQGSWKPSVNASTHRDVLDISGAAHQRLYADHGKTATATFRMACGAHWTFTFRGGVRRANGQYNYSSWATVVSP